MTEKLAPCLCCGATKGLYVIEDDEREWYVFCDGCKMSVHSEHNETRGDAVETWNGMYQNALSMSGRC